MGFVYVVNCHNKTCSLSVSLDRDVSIMGSTCVTSSLTICLYLSVQNPRYFADSIEEMEMRVLPWKLLKRPPSTERLLHRLFSLWKFALLIASISPDEFQI